MTPDTARSDAGFTVGRALRPTAKVLPEHARAHNRALVLQTLLAGGAASRADLARETGLTRVTVSDLVAELIAEGLIVELGHREDARPGKPATLIDFARDAHRILAVDLSEHSLVRGAVVDVDGNVLERIELPLDGATGDAVVELVLDVLVRLQALADAPVLGIGIGSPGVVDRVGVVHSAPNLGWREVDLQRRVAVATGLPVHVGNDANAATLAELRGTASDDLLVVTVGRGVGAGVVLGGRLVFGSAWAAGEIGHVVVGTDGGAPCACGKEGCLETWLSVPRLEARLAAADGEEAREAVLREAGRRLGIVLAPVVGALNLSELVVSGPEELLGGALLGATADTLRNRTMAELTRDLRLRMTAHGKDIVLRGAAVMVLSGQLGVS
ncbi:ROK family transcriptional regulator [Agromyces seonyuensis]|uniref:ROK family protein n=1 Tax=Agromyces seonyuensis TaxID=2662446 RepID=A0A6I4NWX7_9MICO|nr:ROK family transcriptional regulator [Agromyces seonyuensis]MWB98790.1 ROK family protein [Agromyces seonyuensis]